MQNNIEALLADYHPQTKGDWINSIQEVMQELALAGLWRAKFFEHAAFYGGTALRILYGLNRFSEDLDFSLLKQDRGFDLIPYLNAIEEELEISGFQVNVEHKIKRADESIRSAFLKAGTLETLIRIGLDREMQRLTQLNEVIKIKIEVDIDPPAGFTTEVKTLVKPFPFSVRTYVPEDLFAGKMHAALCRPYKVRVKGRDWYDMIWYISKGFELNLHHLELRMRQSGHFSSEQPLTPEGFKELLKAKILSLDVSAAKEDIRRFIRNPKEIDGWSQDLFIDLIPRIQLVQ